MAIANTATTCRSSLSRYINTIY